MAVDHIRTLENRKPVCEVHILAVPICTSGVSKHKLIPVRVPELSGNNLLCKDTACHQQVGYIHSFNIEPRIIEEGERVILE